MPMRIQILNGPNLNLLGEREPDIYGHVTLDSIQNSCQLLADALQVELDCKQSNHEGQLVDWIQEARATSAALIINPAGFSFYSVAILDALRMVEGPIIELHISNIHARDEKHRHSIMSSDVDAVICGVGAYGYIVALQAVAQILGVIPESFPETLRKGPF